MPPDPPERIEGDGLSARIIREEIWRRANIENDHFVLAIVGREGSGKSGTALSLGTALDPALTVDGATFHPANALRRIDGNKGRAGTVTILDEAGVGLGSRTWYDDDQILLNQTLQTIRDDNQILIMTIPALNELDSQAQNRLHAYAEITTLEEGECVRFKFKFLEPERGPNGSELYEKYPRRRIDGQRCRVTRLAVGPPPADLWERYNEKKAEWKDKLYKDTIAELEATDDKDENQPEPQELADKILSNGGLDQYLKEINNGSQVVLDADLLAAEHNLGQRTAKKTKALLLKESDHDVM